MLADLEQLLFCTKTGMLLLYSISTELSSPYLYIGCKLNTELAHFHGKYLELFSINAILFFLHFLIHLSDFIHPEIQLCDQGQSITVDCKKDFLPETVCNVSVSDNMDKAPSLSYQDTSTGSCGFTRTWSSKDLVSNAQTGLR